MKIGNKIAQFRKYRGLNQKQLAEKIGVSAVTITRYENNSREPNLKKLNEIAIALDVTVSDLLNEEYGIDLSQSEPQLKQFLQLDRNLLVNILFGMSSNNEIGDFFLHDEDYEFLIKLIKDILKSNAIMLTNKNFEKNHTK